MSIYLQSRAKALHTRSKITFSAIYHSFRRQKRFQLGQNNLFQNVSFPTGRFTLGALALSCRREHSVPCWSSCVPQINTFSNGSRGFTCVKTFFFSKCEFSRREVSLRAVTLSYIQEHSVLCRNCRVSRLSTFADSSSSCSCRTIYFLRMCVSRTGGLGCHHSRPLRPGAF